MPANGGDCFKLDKWRPAEPVQKPVQEESRSEKHEKEAGTGGVEARYARDAASKQKQSGRCKREEEDAVLVSSQVYILNLRHGKGLSMMYVG